MYTEYIVNTVHRKLLSCGELVKSLYSEFYSGTAIARLYFQEKSMQGAHFYMGAHKYDVVVPIKLKLVSVFMMIILYGCLLTHI